MRLTELKLTAKSDLTSRSFIKGNVSVTPRSKFQFFEDCGKKMGIVTNWSAEHKCHHVTILTTATVDRKPIHFVEKHEVDCQTIGRMLSSTSFNTIKELKAAI